jgi:hypothetical protein
MSAFTTIDFDGQFQLGRSFVANLIRIAASGNAVWLIKQK